MVQTPLTFDKEPMDLQGLEAEVCGVYLQSPSCAALGGERDSGYDSLRRRMSVLERLTQTHPVWLLLAVSEEEATRILLTQPPGVFLVRKSAALQRKILSVRLKEDQSGTPISHLPVRESQYTFSLEESGISFADLFRLVAFYCISRMIDFVSSTDQVLEKAMHKCVLKPLKSVIEVALHDFQVKSGALQQLKENLALANAKRPQELGVDGAVPPDPLAIEKIRHKFLNMRKMYSPEKKVSLLLRVCKLIYTIMQDNSGRMYGADDFLPMLTYVVAQCDMPQLDTEIQYMMELLDPSLLQGEGGYYLTSAYGAMALIKNFQEEQAARVLSSEARNTLHHWHRRRTTPRSAPTVDDFQNYLRVALQEVDTGCTAKTLMVQPYTTTEEVCSLCAYKFKIPDPGAYALFLVIEGTRQQLAPDTHPQRIKAELHGRPCAHTFHFVYRRIPNLNLFIPAIMDNGNCIQVE
ncbi:ras and Rab interactor 2-like [Notothenia coriiceps]|uniref:Ras and Rab interactor 2-like n=1 Tax=Notothenia coriiceps TaxID=8208 RepID=A0A6I9PSB7_9TELE|nr:PREDICTED: ras and Rab interactor 2-like [Notothenia coriiceps]